MVNGKALEVVINTRKAVVASNSGESDQVSSFGWFLTLWNWLYRILTLAIYRWFDLTAKCLESHRLLVTRIKLRW